MGKGAPSPGVGPRAVPRDRGGAPRRDARAGVRGGERLLRPARAGRGARERARGAADLPGDARPVHPAARGRRRFRAGDLARRGPARGRERADPAAGAADRRPGEPAEPPAGPPAGADRARRGPVRAADPAGTAGGPAVGAPAAPSRPARVRAVADRGHRRRRRGARRLLPDPQPDGGRGRNQLPALRPDRERPRLAHRPRADRPAVPGRAHPEAVPREPRAHGPGAPAVRAGREPRPGRGVDVAGRAREAGRGGGRAEEGGARERERRASLSPALHVRTLRLFRGARRAAAAPHVTQLAGADAPRPAGGARPLLRGAGRRLAGGAARRSATPAS